MPSEMETIGFNLKFLTDTKALEKLKEILGEDFEKTEKLQEAIKRLNKIANVYNNLTAKNYEKTGNKEKAKEYKDLAQNLKLVASMLDNVITKETTLMALSRVSKKKGETFTPEKSSLSRELDDTTYTVAPYVAQTKTTLSKDGSEIEEVIEKGVVEIDGAFYNQVVKTIDGEIKSITQKTDRLNASYKSSDFKGVSSAEKILSTKINQATGLITQSTMERVGDYIVSRTYKDGILSSTKEMFKPTKPPKDTKPSKEPKELKEPKEKDILKNLKLNKFIDRVKNIVVYRLVRVIMSAMAKAFKEGFELLSASSPAAKNAMVELKSATVSLQVTLAQLLLPIVQQVSSLFYSFSSNLLNSANAAALLSAQAKGQTKYFQLSQEAIDEYSKSLQNANSSLSQLDKFATLSNNKPMLGQWVEITEESTKEAKKYQGVLTRITQVVNLIVEAISGVLQVLVWISQLTEKERKILGSAIISILLVISMLSLNISASWLAIGGLITGLVILLNSDLAPALKFILGLALAVATAFAIISALSPAGTTKVMAALISASLVGATIYSVASQSGNSLNYSTPDIGQNEASANYSAYGNNLPTGFNAGYATPNYSIQSTAGNVYLDGHKVGTATAPYVKIANTKAGV